MQKAYERGLHCQAERHMGYAKSMLTARQIRGARAMLGIDQPTLAAMAGLSRPTIQRLEHPDFGPDHSALRIVTAVMRALEEAGVEFLAPANGQGEGVRLAHPKPPSGVPASREAH